MAKTTHHNKEIFCYSKKGGNVARESPRAHRLLFGARNTGARAREGEGDGKVELPQPAQQGAA